MDRGDLSAELTRDQACWHQTRHQAAALISAGIGTRGHGAVRALTAATARTVTTKAVVEEVAVATGDPGGGGRGAEEGACTGALTSYGRQSKLSLPTLMEGSPVVAVFGEDSLVTAEHLGV